MTMVKRISEFIGEQKINPFIGTIDKSQRIFATNDTIRDIVRAAIIKYGQYADLNFIDVSCVSDMSNLFTINEYFNGDISKWDMHNVENTENMFDHSSFNGDISKWDMRNVENMSFMFSHSRFNGDISKWNVTGAKYMPYMFYKSSFEGDLSNWNVENVVYTTYMFCRSRFNGDISNWNMRNVRYMCGMFANSRFNGDISNWKINESQLIEFDDVFKGSPLESNPPEWYVRICNNAAI